jgi:peptidoglycan/xylan/chitin deacetylase (PgdA/CDA1 family)
VEVGRALLCCVAVLAAGSAAAAESCRGHVYLTLDTGNMSRAEEIAGILRKYDVRATFFLANEKTPRGDGALDAGWVDYWKARVAEGHAFGTHTLRHGRLLGDGKEDAVVYRPQFVTEIGQTVVLTPTQFCAELAAVDKIFQKATGQKLDPLWRAPGGTLTGNALAAAQRCGYAHVRWAPAGFLGDELPSDKYPNQKLLAQALRDIRDGDVLMAHLGIWSRQDPFAPMLDPLIAGLKQRGLCFRTLREHPGYRAAPPVARELAANAK